MILNQIDLRYKQLLKAFERESVWFEYYADIPEFLEEALLMGLGIPRRIRDKIVITIWNELEENNEKYYKMMRTDIRDGEEKELFLEIVKMFYKLSKKEVKRWLKNKGSRKNKNLQSLFKI